MHASKLGMVRCKRCQTYEKPEKLDENGNCPACVEELKNNPSAS